MILWVYLDQCTGHFVRQQSMSVLSIRRIYKSFIISIFESTIGKIGEIQTREETDDTSGPRRNPVRNGSDLSPSLRQDE